MKLVHIPVEVFANFVLKHVSLDDVVAMIRSGVHTARYVRDALHSLHLEPPGGIPKDRIVVAPLTLSKEDRLFGTLPHDLLRVFVHYVLDNMQGNDQADGSRSSIRNTFLHFVRLLCQHSLRPNLRTKRAQSQ